MASPFRTGQRSGQAPRFREERRHRLLRNSRPCTSPGRIQSALLLFHRSPARSLLLSRNKFLIENKITYYSTEDQHLSFQTISPIYPYRRVSAVSFSGGSGWLYLPASDIRPTV